jgi:hypothetical protein
MAAAQQLLLLVFPDPQQARKVREREEDGARVTINQECISVVKFYENGPRLLQMIFSLFSYPTTLSIPRRFNFFILMLSNWTTTDDRKTIVVVRWSSSGLFLLYFLHED